MPRSIHPGVSWHRGAGRWRAYFYLRRVHCHIPGYYRCETAAFLARHRFLAEKQVRTRDGFR